MDREMSDVHSTTTPKSTLRQAARLSLLSLLLGCVTCVDVNLGFGWGGAVYWVLFTPYVFG